MNVDELKVGDWVQVKPEFDIPEILRPNGPTKGKVEKIIPVDGLAPAFVNLIVPIGDADIEEHSQVVPYTVNQLEPTEAP